MTKKFTYVIQVADGSTLDMQVYFAHSDGLTEKHKRKAIKETVTAIYNDCDPDTQEEWDEDDIDVEVLAVLEGHAKVIS